MGAVHGQVVVECEVHGVPTPSVTWLKNGEVEVASIRPAKEILEQDALARKVMGQKLMWYGAFDKNHYGAVYQQ